ncbi:hypothetical protein [Nocardia jiangxiensis]|uniref:hypothetical protein n=1 Tax=Nocardia jiangxiensis TaxID=282685 RepID=UPI00031434BE|nr:hypothetical protein [Nocardia jiangxiensis]
MGAPEFNFGKAEITAFNEAVAAGTFSISADAAEQAKREYDLMITELNKLQRKLDALTRASGFGGFQSAQELQSGFIGKATEGKAVIEKLIDAASQLQVAYLRAGKQLAEADQINADRLKRITDDVQNG